MSVAAIIPARYASTRFPGKVLANATGKPLIQHVYESVSGARRLDRVLIATDDERIVHAIKAFGGQVMMTRADHTTGTDRVAEVAERLDDDLIINVQGDEPEINPEAIDTLVELMQDHPETPMGSLACPFKTEADVLNPACVKVVLDQNSRALYFSRSLIPYPRDTQGKVDIPSHWLLHLGVYAYRRDFLLKLTRTPPTQLEKIEKLEQLRALYTGATIAIGVVRQENAGIDTPEEYAAFVERNRTRSGT